MGDFIISGDLYPRYLNKYIEMYHLNYNISYKT